MPGNNNQTERDPSSGRPVMRDVVAKIPRKKPLSRQKSDFGEPLEPDFNPVAPKKFVFPSRKMRYGLGGAVLVVGIAIWLLSSFSQVRIVITPRQEFIEVASSISASANSSQEVALEAVSVEDTLELDATVETIKNATEKARGQVLIFNAYATQPQTLVASTRFEAPDGKIYRIAKAVTVPGAKLENGKLAPRSVEVTVFADKPGPEYNLGLSDFTIPGFKGTAKYEKFYGRSKTEITGGFSGSSKIITKEDVDALMKRAEDGFRNSLKEKMERDLPRGIFLPEKAVEIKATLEEVDPPVNSPGEKVRVKVKGVGQAMAVKRSELVGALAKAHLSLEAGESVDLKNLENLNFDVLAKNFKEKTMTLKASGQAHFIWLFDNAALKKELAGASRKTRQEVFKNYSGIERAEINFWPSWWRFFPSDTSRIKIEQIIKENP